MEKLLPQNIEAERGVIGSIIIDPEAISHVADFLRPTDFYREAHRQIYAAIFELHMHHEPADFLTLCDALERKNVLDDVGGASYITSLINQVPTSANIEYYGRIVERTAILRRLIHAAGEIAAIAYDEVDAHVALQQSEQILYSVDKRTNATGFLGMSAVMAEYMHELEAVHSKRGTIIGVPTGFTDMDNLLGGLQKTDLVILAGRPSMGKSALALGMAHNAAKKGYKVALFSLEMGRKQLALRLTAMETRLDMQRLRHGWVEDNEWEQVTSSCGRIADLPIWINDTSGNPVVSMRSQLRRLVAEHGIDLVIVDYLQLIDPLEDGQRGKRDNRVNEIGEITRGLKALAKEFDVPVLALAQLSRAVEMTPSKIPQLAHLRESGSIENDADVVMFVYRNDYYELRDGKKPEELTRPNEADIIVAKHRNGPCGTVALHFAPQFTQFSNLEVRMVP